MKIVDMTLEEIEENKALKWWNSLPMQDLDNCKEGWANYVMYYYPDKTDCQDVTEEEILFIYKKEYND